MKSSVTKRFEENAEIVYSRHPRIIWAIFLLVGLTFVLLQSYFALPRSLPLFIKDSFFPIVVIITGLLLLKYPNNKNLLIFGILYFFMTIITFFTNWIPKPYGTFFFLLGVWGFTDYHSFIKYKRSVFSELMRGNYYLAFGVILSTFIFGIITEVVNLPFMIWDYTIPLPSIDFWGIPALIAAFGWTPWTLAILAIFYPFVLRRPSAFTKFKRIKKVL